MTVKLRLMRMGKKKQPTYRVVVADSRSPRDGRFIEAVGTYAPRMEPSTIEIDNARVLGLVGQGCTTHRDRAQVARDLGSLGAVRVEPPSQAGFRSACPARPLHDSRQEGACEEGARQEGCGRRAS